MQLSISKVKTIKSVEDWQFIAPPKDEKKQWKDGRSAKELARFVTGDSFIPMVETILSQIGIKENCFSAEPEAETYFQRKPIDLGTHGPRNHDLLMTGSKCVIGVEAKVSEPFGETIENEWLQSNMGDNKKKRILGLVEFVTGIKYDSIEDLPQSIKKQRYQLFTSTAGTIQAALDKGLKQAVLLILVFDGNVSKEASYEDNIKNNLADYNSFVNAFFKNGFISVQGVKCHIVKRVVHINQRYGFD